MISGSLLVLALHILSALAAPAATSTDPLVTLDGANVIGKISGNTEMFLGIPYAQPPVGDLRFRLPQPFAYSKSVYDAKNYGPSCPQQVIKLPLVKGVIADVAEQVVETLFGAIFPESEDCLTVNVVRPKGVKASEKLPVVAWIFGGGFELGATSMYDGGIIVQQSLNLNQPVIYVSMNYRVTGFGFLASKEVKEAGVGNLGLQDQRLALRWIQKYIGLFGGDPSKVTIWGESAGAISAALHMVANNGNHEGLFRGAFMQSGAPIPVGDITNGQVYYDSIVTSTGCSKAADTLACLRTVPFAKLKDAINDTPGIFEYQSLRLAWLPRTDGVFITEDPQKLVQQGKVANVPYVNGNCDDEGTLFSIANANITTTAQFKTYLKTVFLPGISDAQVDRIAELYPQDITQGSPFNTGILNALTPQSKRLAAFQGDGVFQAPRRWFLQHTSGKQNVWAYVSKRFKALPFLGSLHAHDIFNVYAFGDMGEHLIRFTNNLNPNPRFGFQWPRYTPTSKKLLVYQDGLISQDIQNDDYREEAMRYLTEVTLEHPV